jgi:hypothetical protein
LTALLVGFACYLTWPQCLYLATRVASHDDAFFSTWRVAWIAHALRTDPSRLYDANIFYPDRGTLANSDAVILEGALGSPFLWAGASPVVVYNLLLLGGIVASGLGMFLLARHLTGDSLAGLVAAAVFMMVPYRVEHFEHLELQWTCFIPLSFWAIHKAFDESSFVHGLLAGALVWLQLIACVYYGIFLGFVVFVLSLLLLIPTRNSNRPFTALLGVMAGGLVAVLLALVSLRPYLDNVSRLGMRPTTEIVAFSAVFRSYLSAPVENWLWGWTSPMFHGDELHLFPGVIATLLALAGLALAPRRTAVVYGIILLLGVELSLGLNGRLYSFLLHYVSPLQGLRAPARASIFAFAALAVLAGFGTRALRQKRPEGRPLMMASVAVIAALCIEFGSAPMRLQPAPRTPPLYRFLKQLPPGVVAEFPIPRRFGWSAYDTLYMFSSISHWYPLVNGYSGFIPEHYRQTISLLSGFPDGASLKRLREIGARYVIVHQHGYQPEEYNAIIFRLRARRDVVPFGRYQDVEGGQAELFELAPHPGSDPG